MFEKERNETEEPKTECKRGEEMQKKEEKNRRTETERKKAKGHERRMQHLSMIEALALFAAIWPF